MEWYVRFAHGAEAPKFNYFPTEAEALKAAAELAQIGLHLIEVGTAEGGALTLRFDTAGITAAYRKLSKPD
jgi:hypothetical protein